MCNMSVLMRIGECEDISAFFAFSDTREKSFFSPQQRQAFNSSKYAWHGFILQFVCSSPVESLSQPVKWQKRTMFLEHLSPPYPLSLFSQWFGCIMIREILNRLPPLAETFSGLSFHLLSCSSRFQCFFTEVLIFGQH